MKVVKDTAEKAKSTADTSTSVSESPKEQATEVFSVQPEPIDYIVVKVSTIESTEELLEVMKAFGFQFSAEARSVKDLETLKKYSSRGQ